MLLILLIFLIVFNILLYKREKKERAREREGGRGREKVQTVYICTIYTLDIVYIIFLFINLYRLKNFITNSVSHCDKG